MAYPKITVNTGLAKEIIASDTIPIPAPDLPVLSGTTTAATANYLPIQIVQLYSTSTTAAARNTCLAIW